VATDRAAGTLLIIGSAVFLVGAAIGVPGVFTQRDPEVRLRMLTAHLGRWRAAQPLYGLGPLVAAAGVGALAAGASGATRTLFAVSCAALVLGGLAWAWSLYLRGTRVREFAYGALPGWPFATYVLLTIAGLALFGVGLLDHGPAWLAWLVLAADAAFLAGYLRFKDIPPFVFYVLLVAVGVVLLF
jgi:hypothetical protein